MARCCSGTSVLEAMHRAEAAAEAAEEAAEAAEGTETFYGFGAPGVISGSEPGDHYVDLDTGTVYVLS